MKEDMSFMDYLASLEKRISVLEGKPPRAVPPVVEKKVVCPACGRDDFSNETRMLLHIVSKHPNWVSIRDPQALVSENETEEVLNKTLVSNIETMQKASPKKNLRIPKLNFLNVDAFNLTVAVFIIIVAIVAVLIYG